MAKAEENRLKNVTVQYEDTTLKTVGSRPDSRVTFFARPKKVTKERTMAAPHGVRQGRSIREPIVPFEKRLVFVGPNTESGSMRNRSTRLSQTPALHGFESHTSPSPFRPARIRRSSVGVIGTHSGKGPPLHATEMPPAGEAAFCLLFVGLQKVGRLPGRVPAV